MLWTHVVNIHAWDEKLRPCFLTIAIKRLACGISIGESISMVYLDRNSRMFYHIHTYIYIYKYLTRPQKQYTCVLSHAGSVTSPTKNYVLQDAIEDVSSGVTGLQKATLFHANLSSLMFLAPEDLKSK